ncbi:MAG: PilZ domain-containing protein [Nitrospirae bacterium]|nr:PilZ domain-containing protein [Nitrospirota bacterium]
MALEKRNKRSEERYPYLRTIKYICLPDSEGDFKGVTIDISKAGMSLYIFSPCCIREGHHVKVKDDLPLPSTTGVVRWVKQVDHDLYRAGLQFR